MITLELIQMTIFWWTVLTIVGLLVCYTAVVIINQKTYILRSPDRGEPIDLRERPNRALLVIDIQNIPLFAEGKPSGNVSETGRLIGILNRAIDRFRDRALEVLFIAQVKEKGLRSFFLPHIAARDSKAAEVCPRLHREDSAVITKLRADAFSNPELERHLAERRIGELYIAGMAAEVCVLQTIRGALNRGYRVFAVQDAIYAIFGEASKVKMMETYHGLRVEMIRLEDLETILPELRFGS